MWDWLLAPMDAASAHDVEGLLSWHARVMVLAWGVLVPLGIFIARFFKIVPGQDWPRSLDHHFWWNTHRVCQYSASALMAIGLVLILLASSSTVKTGPHSYIGWAVIALGVTQIVGGILRGTKGGPTAPAPDGTLRGDHFDMTPRRLAFEYIHKCAGYAALILSVTAILTGLWQANAPNWMWLSLCIWWASLLATAIVMQIHGMAVDTYQAIWGPDPTLPGNKRKPIGLGVSRRGE